MTAHQVVGEYCRLQQNPNLIYDLVDSDRHWDRRMAIVGTFAYIRKGELDLTFEIAEKFLIETEDLMHKATGWMLRETGKKDMSRLRNFIENHGSQMPRTMLRYEIEKFPERDRKKVLETTKSR